MNWGEFGIRMFAALLFGGVIGLERQWRQRMTGLRTNGLVAVGSAMFIMMGGLIAGEGSAHRINRTPIEKEEHEILYRLSCTCRAVDEANVRTMLIQGVGRTPLILIALLSRDEELLARVNVKAYLKSLGPKEESLEQIVTRLSLESGVTAISWEIVAAVDAEDASITSSDELIQANS